jgi:predicted transcriptional regulator
MKYRGKPEINMAILQACSRDNGVNQQKIIFKAELSYIQLKDYIISLTDKKLIEQRDRRYVITEKGKNALKLLTMVNDIFGP